MPKLSILLPFLKNDETLDRAILSILDQSYRDFELLLIHNDNRPFPEEVTLRHTDPKIRPLSEARKGISFALNTGLLAARGRFIGRMDADDYAYPTRFEKQIRLLEKRSDLGATGCRTRFVSDQNAKGYSAYVDWQNALVEEQAHFEERFRESPLAHPSLCFRSSLIRKFGPYATEAVPEDYELLLRWMENGIKIAKVPEVLLDWHDPPERLSRNHPNYSEEAFAAVKARFLKPHLRKHKVLLCGSSDTCHRLSNLLQNEGLQADAWTDILPKKPYPFPYLRPEDTPGPGNWVVLSLIAQGGSREKVRDFFRQKGFRPGIDFFSCA